MKLELIKFELIEGALCPISSIACAHISSTALQKSARVNFFDSDQNLFTQILSHRKIHVVLQLLNFKMNKIYIHVPVPIGKTLNCINLFLYFKFLVQLKFGIFVIHIHV